MDTPTLLWILLALAALAVVLLIVLLLRRPERALESALREEQREGRGELRGQLADSIQRTDSRLDDLRTALTDDAHKSRSDLALRQQQFEESLAARLRELGDRNTQTLGEWALWLFYLGAVVTLYGTVFASTAANSRLFADAFRIAGFYERNDGASRVRWRNRFVVILSVLPVTFYWFLRSPVQMVVAGGLAQALMLPLIGIAVIYLRHTKLPDEIRPSVGTTVMLWVSTAVMAAFASYYLWSRIS